MLYGCAERGTLGRAEGIVSPGIHDGEGVDGNNHRIFCDLVQTVGGTIDRKHQFDLSAADIHGAGGVNRVQDGGAGEHSIAQGRPYNGRVAGRVGRELKGMRGTK